MVKAEQVSVSVRARVRVRVWSRRSRLAWALG